ncbi:MBL fold metallo-hydrolase [Mumia sp. DW29H23]|uniref:MBL fold metallo-hydrolase n=1 Tax=Mumia sp. DW29H23 TaxID=3421241 RepID=UPI003D69CED1
MRRRRLVGGAATMAMLAAAATVPGAADASPKPRHDTRSEVGFVIGAAEVRTRPGGAEVAVPVLGDNRRTWAVTDTVPAATAASIKAAVRPGTLVDYRVSRGEVVVPDDATQTFHTVLTKGSTPVFDTMKYGPELAPYDGEPGDLVAAGWVYGKDKNTLTLGDGRKVTADITGRALPKVSKRYEETYRVARDVDVYEVNTADWSQSRPSTFSRVPVTESYDHANTDRKAAFVVFDRSYRQAKAAKVRAIYYFTPSDTSDGKPVWDVPTGSTLLEDKGVDPVSGTPYVDISATGVTQAPYTRSTEPFEIVPGTFFYVGDNEVSLYLFDADMGTRSKRDDRLVLMDTGWPNSGYQYWKNIEAMGYDPRDVDDILMAHGHGDHYGTTDELVTMIENAGGSVRLHSPREDIEGLAQDAVGNTWNLPPALPASETLIRERTGFFQYDAWMDFGNVRLLPLWSPGHTPGSASFVFSVDDPDSGEALTFGYMGGYGWSPKIVNARNGWQRLGFAHNLAWLQQRYGDVDYAAPQHANQFPLVEIYQALKAYNNDPANARRPLSMLDAMVKDQFVNQLEKRYEVATNAISDTIPGYQSIESFGPFKPGRENGVVDAQVRLVDGGKVIQGYDKAMNVNPRIPLLADGVTIDLDSHVHDPEGWYVQFELDVLDSYGGFLPGVGPVESIRPEVTEVLRTQRFASRAEAEAVLATVRAGGTYRVDLTKASAIVVPTDGPVFEEVR